MIQMDPEMAEIFRKSQAVSSKLNSSTLFLIKIFCYSLQGSVCQPALICFKEKENQETYWRGRSWGKNEVAADRCETCQLRGYASEGEDDGGSKVDDIIKFLNGEVKQKLDEINTSVVEIKDVLATQNQLAELSGLSHSALSKIENNQLSPTFESILKIVGGLNIDVSDLLTSIKNETPRTRQVFTRKGRGEIHETENYQYETLCNGIINKKMIPIVTKVKSHSLQKFGEMIRHSGEELFYVLEGTVDLITEHYASVKLEQGDCAYFDSSMGHACISTGEKDALIFWVSTPS